MDTLSLFFIFVFGTLVGSFLNVIALRYNTGLSPLKGRSMCFNCGNGLRWYDMIPVISFLILRGKCRSCGSRLSWQYPIIELLTGLVFVGIALRQYYVWPLYSMLSYGLAISIALFFFYAIVFSILIVILLYDYHHKIIPDKLVFMFIILGIIKLIFFLYINNFAIDRVMLIHMFSPFALSLPLAGLWLVSRGKWIGLGDAKLTFGIVVLVGFTLGLSAMAIAFWLGAVWGVGMIVLDKMFKHPDSTSFSSEISFAPFLVSGLLIAFFTHIDVFGISQILHL